MKKNTVGRRDEILHIAKEAKTVVKDLRDRSRLSSKMSDCNVTNGYLSSCPDV